MRSERIDCIRISPALLGWVVAFLTSSAAQQPTPAPDALYTWFTIPMQIEGLPPGAGSVPVSKEIDLSAALEQLQASGAVDEHSLGLFRIAQDGSRFPEPVQFVSKPQPRAGQRELLPGTSPAVSYLGEQKAGVSPHGIRAVGELTWIARADADGRAEYRLEFGTLRSGRSVQVPFPPQNLRMFDEHGNATPLRWFPQMQIRPQWPLGGAVQVFEGPQLVTSYHLGPVVGQSGSTPFRRPFLYPVNGPDGVSLTEFGKPHDPTGSHAHHYSLWIAHASVAGKDFWAENGGTIAHEQFELMEDGPIFCRLVQKTRWLDGQVPVLREKREFTFYKTGPGFRLIDLDLQLTPARNEPVTFGKTSFGFLAVRVAQSMTVFDGGGEILNANGDRNEQGAHLKRAAWIDQSGPVAQDRWSGIAILDCPENSNSPTGWHCRNDGWAGAAFNLEGPYTLEPGKTLRLRYRIVLHRGNATQAQVAERFTEYAARPIVNFGKPTARPAEP